MSKEKKKLRKVLSGLKVPKDEEFFSMSREEQMRVCGTLLDDSDRVQTHMMEEVAFQMNECSVCFKKFPTKTKETEVFFKKYCDDHFPHAPEVQQKARRTIEDIFK